MNDDGSESINKADRKGPKTLQFVWYNVINKKSNVFQEEERRIISFFNGPYRFALWFFLFSFYYYRGRDLGFTLKLYLA